MDEPLIMLTPLPPAEVLARLAAYGQEWRESKIPPTLRSAGIHTCKIAVENERFRLHLNRVGRDPSFVWIGKVAASGQGSRIDASWEVARESRIYNLALLGFLGIAWAWISFRAGAWWPPIIGLAFMSGAIAFSTASASRRQRGFCAAILTHVADAKTCIRAPAA